MCEKTALRINFLVWKTTRLWHFGALNSPRQPTAADDVFSPGSLGGVEEAADHKFAVFHHYREEKFMQTIFVMVLWDSLKFPHARFCAGFEPATDWLDQPTQPMRPGSEGC